MLDVVLVLQVHPHHADAAAALLAVGRDRQPLDVAGLGDRDHHVLFRDHVLELKLFLGGDDLRATVVAAAIDALQLEQLVLDQRIDLLLGAEQVAQLVDALANVLELVLDALALERGQREQAQLEDRNRLPLGQVELRLETLLRRVGVCGRADECDDRVEVVERDQVALQYVRALLLLAQLVLRAARDDLALEVEVVREQLEQRERLRDAVDERNGVDAERRLQRRVLEQLVQGDLRDGVALQLDLDAHAGPVGVVLQVGDLRQHLVVDELGDLRDHPAVAALLHAVRKLRDDDRALAAAQLFDVCARPHHDAAAARAKCIADTTAADDDRTGREVGALHVLHQVLDARLRVVDQRDDRVDDLTEVVRRDVRRHAHRDAVTAVHEQVREARRQDERLALRLVVVRPEVDGVRVELAQHLLREL